MDQFQTQQRYNLKTPVPQPSINTHPLSSVYPGPYRRDSSLSRKAYSSLSPPISSSLLERKPGHSQASWERSATWLCLEILSRKTRNRIVTNGSPVRVQHLLGTSLTYCQQCGPSSCKSCTRTEWLIQTHPPQHTPRHVVESLVQVHKTHVDWLGKIPRILKYSWEDIEFIQCSMNRTKLSCKPSWGGWGVWFLGNWNTACGFSS